MHRLAKTLLVGISRRLPQLKYLPRGVELVWTASKAWSIAWIALIVVSGLIPAAMISLTKRLVDSLVRAAQAHGSWESVRPVVIMGGLLFGASIGIEVLRGILEWVREAQSETVQDHLTELIQTKAVEVDIAFYEAAEYYDRLYRARDDAHGRMAALLEHVGAVCQNTITLIALTVIVAAYNGLLVAVMLASVLPAFYVVAHYNWLTHKWWVDTTVQRRWLLYYEDKFTSATAAAEIRLFRLGPHFQAAFQALRGTLRESRLTLIKRQNKAGSLAALLGALIAGAAITWVGRKTLTGQATFGDMALFYQAFLGGQGFMRMVTISLAQAYSKSLFLEDLFDFLALQPQITDPAHPVPAPAVLKRGIEFHNVSFQYPGSERLSLRNLTVAIPAGKIVAIVGPNGAGKSTLIKLASRFYDPSEGYITIDGIPLGSMRVSDVRSMLSILFQRPVNYDATAAENIAIGALGNKPSRAEVRKASERAGLDVIIGRLPDGYDTRLGKAFAQGTDLSSGEWQRVAMARAFLRQAPIILLDEPTSFMDSWAEVEWFDRLQDLASGRTTMIVTHRFTIAMRADLIHVMDGGRVVESGSHEALFRCNGLYAQSWREQILANVGSKARSDASAPVQAAS